MSSNQISMIPTQNRDVLFSEIKRIVNEADAIDRMLEPIGEAIAHDEALEQIADLIDCEIQ